MIKKLVRHGNSRALVIDKPVLDLLNIDEDTEIAWASIFVELTSLTRSNFQTPSRGKLAVQRCLH